MKIAKTSSPNKLNRIVYILFFGMGILFFALKDFNNAMIFLGLAPVFDPFDPAIKFADRRKWQNGLLLLNLALALSALVLLIIK